MCMLLVPGYGGVEAQPSLVHTIEKGAETFF